MTKYSVSKLVFIASSLIFISVIIVVTFVEINAVQAIAPDVPKAWDEFWHSVSISWDMAIIWSPWRSNMWNIAQWSAFVLHNEMNKWKIICELKSSDWSEGDEFWWSVSIAWMVAVVWAKWKYKWDVPSQWAAYVFDVASCMELAKLSAPDWGAEDQFWSSVSISWDDIIVWAFWKNKYAGAAYLFHNFSWKWTFKWFVSKAQDVWDYFWNSVAIWSHNYIAWSEMKSSARLGAHWAVFIWKK